MNRKITTSISFLILFFISIINTAQNHPAADSLKYKSNPNYILQMRMFDLYKTKQADIVMLGNSLTAGANWAELLGRSNVVGRGITGDILQGFYARMSTVYKLKPKIVFICGGLNDIYAWTPVEDVYYNYIRIVTSLQARNIIPVIQSTTYASRDYAKEWGGTPEVNLGRNKEVDKLNKLLYEYAKKNNIDYIDIVSKMSTRDNYLRPELTWDGVHFNAEGYKIWAREIEKVLTKYKF
ncbi:MAG: GDSL-type esterase/lipase family protein [Bacteroidota bacterium]